MNKPRKRFAALLSFFVANRTILQNMETYIGAKINNEYK
jgi:hypothetical protein